MYHLLNNKVNEYTNKIHHKYIYFKSKNKIINKQLLSHTHLQLQQQQQEEVVEEDEYDYINSNNITNKVVLLEYELNPLRDMYQIGRYHNYVIMIL